jgi:hypothetical protein
VCSECVIDIGASRVSLESRTSLEESRAPRVLAKASARCMHPDST